MNKLTLQLPTGYVEALSRRHNGRELPEEERLILVERMEMFYSQYLKAKKKEEKLWKFWDEKNVEGHFQRPIWYNAHSRRKVIERDIKSNASSMFYTLLQADGNSTGERYDPFWCLSAIEIYEDFSRKYKK